MLPIETATSSHPLAPYSFSLVCILWVSGSTSTIIVLKPFRLLRFDSKRLAKKKQKPEGPKA